jgi:putative peptidoglycan lipid II flippase
VGWQDHDGETHERADYDDQPGVVDWHDVNTGDWADIGDDTDWADIGDDTDWDGANGAGVDGQPDSQKPADHIPGAPADATPDVAELAADDAPNVAADDAPHGATEKAAADAAASVEDPARVAPTGVTPAPPRRGVVGLPGRGHVGRAAALMAVGTTLSRATGVLRIFAVAYALGASQLADGYNLANTMPNIVHDVVLGGILAATFVPVFVERLTTRAEDDAWTAVSAVVSVTMVVIAVASLLFVAASAFLIDATTALNHGAQAAQERRVATDLLWLFAPQLTCYGFISLGTALLNARRRFGAPAFAPIANNVVLIVILLVFGTTVHDATLSSVDGHTGRLLLLGIGTTLGVIAQAAAMVPSLRRAGLQLRWNLDFHHEAVHRILRLSGWTFGLVVANQVALLVVLALSEKVGTGTVSAYTYAYTFFQLPYGVVAVSIMSATAPELAAHWSTGDLVAFRRRMATGLRAMLAIIIPAAALEVVLARPLVELVLGHGAARHDTAQTAVALAMLALGLPGFCAFLYAVRVLQSVQDLRSAFWLYAFENAVNIVLAVVLAERFGLRGITLSISIAYTLAAVVALAYLRTRVDGLGGALVGRPLGHVVVATAALVLASALASNISGSQSTVALLAEVVLGTIVGGLAYVVAAGGLAQLHARRTRGRPGGDGTGSQYDDGGGPPPTPGPVLGDATGELGRGGRSRRARRAWAPSPPEPLPPAGRPPLRPQRLGPTRTPGATGSREDEPEV